MSQNSVKVIEPLRIPGQTTFWVDAYRKYLKLWLNLAKTVNISDEEAQDIVHGIISSLVSDPSKKFESTEHIRNYVAKSVLNRAIQAKQTNGRRTHLTENIELQFALATQETDGDELQQMQALKEAIQQLPRKHFEIIKLRFYSGLTFIEISGWLHVPISTLKSREDAAIRNIRKWLRKKGL